MPTSSSASTTPKPVARASSGVTKMSRGCRPPWPTPGGAREVDRAGELGDERQRLVDGGRRVVPHRDVQRLGRDVLLRPVRDRPLDAGGDRLDDGRMEQRGFGGAGQRVREHLGLFGDDVEPEDLDGHQAVARRLIGAKNGTESTNTNLMQHPEGAECWRRRKALGSSLVSDGTPRADRQNVTRIPGSSALSRASQARCHHAPSLTAFQRL